MLNINQLLYKRGSFQLDISSLHLKTGLTVLVGENGAGKTSFLNILATSEQHHRGTVDYKGMTLKDGLLYIRGQIGFVPSGMLPYDHMTVKKFLLYMAHLKGIYNQEAVKEILCDFNLDTIKSKKIKHLSQGQIQRVSIAQAFLGKPNYVFLDEPLDYLDTIERKTLVNYLNQYTKKRLVILATHDLSEWEDLVDHILWLDHGEVQFYGNETEWKHLDPFQIFVYKNVTNNAKLPDHPLGIKKKGKNGKEVRAFSEAPQYKPYTIVPPTIEDAYFVRKYLLKTK